MPTPVEADEVAELSDYAYDCARDISRIVTALSTIGPTLLPFCLLWFTRRVGSGTVPSRVREIGAETDIQCNDFWKKQYLAIGILILLYAVEYFISQETYSDIARIITYPVFSTICLMRLRKAKAPTFTLLTFIWTVCVLSFPKAFPYLLGPLVIFYGRWAIRAELSLALVVNRGINPLSAYRLSLKHATKERFGQFAYVLGEIAARVWLSAMLCGGVVGLLLYLGCSWANVVGEAALTLAFAYFDSQMILRGQAMLEYLDEGCSKD